VSSLKKSKFELGFEVVSLPGLTSFEAVYALQEELLEKRIRDEIVDQIIFCEHHSVITRGRGLQRIPGRELRQTPLLAVPEGTQYVETNRGGDLTWHGPGQLVMYPVVKLGGEGDLGRFVHQDVNRYLRFLESVFIDLLKSLSIEATSKPDGSGVWIGAQKVASVGIALRRWVSYHGIALNVVNDLSAFHAFDPCGFEANVMTSLSLVERVPKRLLTQDWRVSWEELIIRSISTHLMSKS
jgi:lipoyl(octanoyl) transferase